MQDLENQIFVSFLKFVYVENHILKTDDNVIHNLSFLYDENFELTLSIYCARSEMESLRYFIAKLSFQCAEGTYATKSCQQIIFNTPL